MNQETIKAIAEFMQRATLQAKEIDVFQACIKALQEAFDNAAPEVADEDA